MKLLLRIIFLTQTVRKCGLGFSEFRKRVGANGPRAVASVLILLLFLPNSPRLRAQWELVYADTTNLWFGLSFINDSTGFTCTYNNSDTITEPSIGMVLKTTDYGITWNDTPLYMEDYFPWDIEDSFLFYDILFLNDQLGWVCGYMPYILKTENGGETWEQYPTGFNAMTKLIFLNENYGIAFDPSTNAAVTYDGGETWYPDENLWGDDASILDECNSVMTVGALIREKINCEPWETTNFAFADNFPIYSAKEIHCLSPDEWIIACSGYGGDITTNFVSLTKTYDGGESFQVIADLYGIGSPQDIRFVSDEVGYVMAYNNEGYDFQDYIFKTLDGGETWYAQHYEPLIFMDDDFNGFSDTECPSANIAYCLSMNRSYVFRTMNGGGELFDLVLRTHELDLATHLSIFPNPTSDILFIGHSSPTAITSFQILDAIGRSCMRNELRGNQVDVSSLAPGLYSVVLFNDKGESVVRRFVKE